MELPMTEGFHSLLSHINPGCALATGVALGFTVRKQWICWAGLDEVSRLLLHFHGHLFGAVLGLHCCVDFPLIVESGVTL